MNAIGPELRAIRHGLGWSLQRVEDKSNGQFKAVVVGSWERGDRHPPVESVRDLLAFYGDYRLVLVHPGGIVHDGTDEGEAAVQYVVTAAGRQIECGSADEARFFASQMSGARIGHRLIGPVVFDEPEALPVNNNVGGRS